MRDLFQKCYDYPVAKMVKASGLYSFFRPVEHSDGTRLTYDGRSVIMIGSNNYLGLTHDPVVRQKAKEAIDRFGSGMTGSRALNGNTVLHNQLERELAEFVGKEEALVFSTGFLSNLGGISCLTGEDDVILSDAENHASIIEGCRLSKAEVVPYRHNNMEALEEKLNAIPEEKGALIVTDGVFSMTGEIVNLPELIRVKNKFQNARLFVDDAHALGTIGPRGEGTAAHFNLTEETELIMGTFSKSFASMGGFVAGPADVIDYIRHNARAFVFSAAMPPASVATVLACLEIVKKEPHRLTNLKENCRFMLEGFERLGISYIPSETPIISIFVGDEGKALQLVMDLFAEGIFATPVAYPAVPYGQALIRTSYMATHSRDELTKVLEVFEKLAPKYGILKDQIEVPTELTHQAQTYNFDALHDSTSTVG